MNYNNPGTRVSPGDRLKIRAADWNDAMRAAARAKGEDAYQPGQTMQFDPSTGLVIKCKNTEADIDFLRGEVVGYDYPVIKPATLTPLTEHAPPPQVPPVPFPVWKNPPDYTTQIAMRIKKPTVNHVGRWGITMEPITRGKFGSVLVAGLARVRIRMEVDTDFICDVLPDDQTALKSSPFGSGRIIWVQPEIERWQDDKQLAWAVVQVGAGLMQAPFRGVVVGIDLGANADGRKKLSVQRLRSMPLGYGGPIIFVDGWIDTMIDCGQEILCIAVNPIVGDAPQQIAYAALPQFAVDQHYLAEPNPSVVATVASPVYAEVTQQCPLQPQP